MINFCIVQTAAAAYRQGQSSEERVPLTEEQLTVIRNVQRLLVAPPTEEELIQLREARDNQERLQLLQQLQQRLGAQADEVGRRRNALMNRRADLAFGYTSPDAGQNRNEVIERMQGEIESMQEEENRLRETIVQIDQLLLV